MTGRRVAQRKRPVLIPALTAGAVVLVTVIGLGLSGDEEPSIDSASAERPAPTVTETLPAVTMPSIEQPVDPVEAARKIKPLEDIEPGDRVLYQGSLCVWDEWAGDIDVSVITCDDETFEIQTGRLTPVELRSDL